MIQLVPTPDNWLSPYGPNKSLVPVPSRMRLLHPAACASWPTLPGQSEPADELIVTDVYRSLTSQLEAYESRKRGVQRPGYSAHNFGLAIDLDVRAMMKRLDCDKVGLDTWMRNRSWTCYRTDGRLTWNGKTASENWHYTFNAIVGGSDAVEGAIQRYYMHEFAAMREPKAIQEALATLRLYDGAIDGKLGPLSRRAIGLFQRQWGIRESTGAPRVGPETARMLVAAVLV